MTITRIINSREVEIELTKEEMDKVYQERDLQYQIEDVQMEIDERAERLGTPDLTDDDVRKIAKNIDDELSGYCVYWEQYWSAVDTCIDRYVKEHNIKIREEED